MSSHRPAVITQLGFMTDGILHGYIKASSGGNVHGEIVEEQSLSGLYPTKRVSNTVYEPLTVQIPAGTVSSPALADWIRRSFDRGAVLKSATVIACDSEGNVILSRDLYDAYIAEVTFPALERNSEDPVNISVKLDPESIQYQKGGSPVRLSGEVSEDFTASSFRFELGALPCNHVNRITPLTWKQQLEGSTVPVVPFKRVRASKIAVSNLQVSISLADIEPWWDWFQDCLIDRTANDEFTGSIDLLSRDLSRSLARIDLQNVGIASLALEQAADSPERLSHFTVDLYVGSIAFSV